MTAIIFVEWSAVTNCRILRDLSYKLKPVYEGGQMAKGAANNMAKVEAVTTGATESIIKTNYVQEAVNTVKDWSKRAWNYFTED